MYTFDRQKPLISLMAPLVLALLVLGGLLMLSTTPAAAQDAETAETTARLNFREGPGLEYEIIRVLPASTQVTFTGERDTTGDWVQVQLADGSTGWVAQSFLSRSPSLDEMTVAEQVDEEETVFPADVVTATTTANLNLRVGPGLVNPVVDVLPQGTLVGFTGFTDETGTWVQVDPVGDTTGWVSAQFLSNVPTTLDVRPVATGPETFPTDVVTTTTTANLNLREGPGLAYDIIETLPQGTTVGFTGFADETGEWVQVDPVDADVGWVAASFLNYVPDNLQTWEGDS